MNGLPSLSTHMDSSCELDGRQSEQAGLIVAACLLGQDLVTFGALQ